MHKRDKFIDAKGSPLHLMAGCDHRFFQEVYHANKEKAYKARQKISPPK